MRSKEVDNAIERGNAFVEENLDKIGGIQGFSIKNGQITFKTKQLKILLNYISELEEEIERIKSVDIYKLVEDADTGQLIHKDKIRDKIKELEEEKKKYIRYKGLEFGRAGAINFQIEVLKELLEGE